MKIIYNFKHKVLILNLIIKLNLKKIIYNFKINKKSIVDGLLGDFFH